MTDKPDVAALVAELTEHASMYGGMTRIKFDKAIAELTRLAAENAKLDHMVKEGAALFLEAASELTRLAHENDTLAKELENATKLFKQLFKLSARWRAVSRRCTMVGWYGNPGKIPNSKQDRSGRHGGGLQGRTYTV